MSSFWENKYNSAEKSIQFIQETHAEVLRALHEQIETLQKQCADYALRLSLQASTASEKEELDKKYKSFNAEYKKKDALIREQKKLIDDRNRCIRSLEERIKTLEKRYETETSSSDSLVKQLKAQIDLQANQIANLTFQIHQLMKLKSLHTNEFNSNSSNQLELSGTSTRGGRRKKNESLNDLVSSINLASQNNSQPNSNHYLFSQVNQNALSLNSTSKMSSKSNTTREDHKQQKQSSKPQRRLSAISVESLSNQHLTGAAATAEADLILASRSILQFESGGAAGSDDYADMLARSGSTASRSNSARSERSLSSPKFLAPPAVNKADVVPPPDPKPFLQSSASTLHSRSKKEIQRRTLISLPPIKPYEINQLAVDCPHKSTLINASGVVNSNDQNSSNN